MNRSAAWTNYEKFPEVGGKRKVLEEMELFFDFSSRTVKLNFLYLTVARQEFERDIWNIQNETKL